MKGQIFEIYTIAEIHVYKTFSRAFANAKNNVIISFSPSFQMIWPPEVGEEVIWNNVLIQKSEDILGFSTFRKPH